MTNRLSRIATTTFAVLLGGALAAHAPAFAAATAGKQNPAPGVSPVGTSGTKSAAVTADYKLVPGDKLRIQVYKDDKLSQDLQVRPDGKITFPLLGDLTAAGRTAADLRDAISKSLIENEINKNPAVTVMVVETIPPAIFVMGEVKNAGEQELRGELTVLQALSRAGGFTEWSKKKVRVLRKSSTGLTTTIDFNYKDAIKGIGKPIVLQAGDTIIVE